MSPIVSAMHLITSHSCADIMTQCFNLPSAATSATIAVCSLIKSHPINNQAIIHNLATLLGSDLDTTTVCIESSYPSASAMKMLLQAISRSESRHPRDPAAAATNLLNTCFSSCRNVSTATLLGLSAVIKTMSNPRNMMSSFCTNPAIALLWQHANNSPRECFDSMIANFDDGALLELFGGGVTTCILRSMLSAYVSLCDQRTIECEESMLLIPDHQLKSCLLVQDAKAICDPQCAALVNQLSSGQQCFERTAAVRETLAQISDSTCTDSGEYRLTQNYNLDA
jgi:hypothetical protein